MKLILVLSLLILVSCSVGKAPQENSGGTGGTFPLNPESLSDANYQRMDAVCNSLAIKQDILSSRIGSLFIFSYSDKKCSDNQGVSRDVAVRLNRNFESFSFNPVNPEQLFVFSEVETINSGSMKRLCELMSGRPRSPMQTAGNTAMLFNSEPCGDKHVCVDIRKGSLVSGIDYKIYNREIIKFRLTDGFFVERTLLTNCEGNKYTEQIAILK